ncbi:hypothetical protein IV500_05915 [Paeniglutamicibacter antarcticus]|uniref:Uncharacterized protein n=1 Tax=Arthrobacter terrae TaxID=2935737 RepID=A0A931G767_9MICC|nr:hypothetical protein [Arthrobacter terrae]MBG0738959.1 hypothetical protein [Arthrobacter terrae]
MGWKLWVEDSYGIDGPGNSSPVVIREHKKRPRKSLGCLFIVVAAVAVVGGCSVLTSKSINESPSASVSVPKGEQVAPGSHVSQNQIDSAAVMDEREMALMVKNPESYKGKSMVVFARITQFDAATGTCTFRADIANAVMEDSWDYKHNSFLTGGDGGEKCPDLAGFVEDDIVRMTVTSKGAYSYDTQIGGHTTVPSFQVEKISRAN